MRLKMLWLWIVASIALAGCGVEQSEVELPNEPGRYLRITHEEKQHLVFEAVIVSAQGVRRAIGSTQEAHPGLIPARLPAVRVVMGDCGTVYWSNEQGPMRAIHDSTMGAGVQCQIGDWGPEPWIWLNKR